MSFVRALALLGGLAACSVACQQAASTATPPATTTTRNVVQALHATPGGVDILTFHGDNARTGWNRHETALTLANVRPETFGLLAVSPDVGDEITSSPLFASNLMVHNATSGTDAMGDVVFVGTMDAKVYALDADDLTALWEFDFEGHHSVSADVLQSCQQPYHVGVVGTPVISPDRTTLYVVGRVSTDDPTDNWLQGYALSTRDGSVTGRFLVGETLDADNTTRTPLTVHSTVHGAPSTVSFQSNMYVQRSALLLQGNYLYVSVGGICDVPGFRGWLFAYDVTHLDMHAPPAATWMPAPQGGAGMWGGGGQASDGSSIFVAVGNGATAMRPGTPDADRQYSDALVRLSPTLAVDPHACFNASTLGACGVGDGANLSNVFMPRNAEYLSQDVLFDPTDLEGPDEDFGSSGPMLLPDATLPENLGTNMGRHLAALGGKDGFFYLIDREHMGGIGPSVLHSDADFATLVGSELWGQELFLHSTSGGIRTTAAYFEGHSGRYMYVLGVDPTSASDAAQGVAAMRIVPVTDPSPAACAGQFRETAHAMAPLPCSTIWGSGTRPGYEVAWSGTGPTNNGGVFVSSNGNDNGIVWVAMEQGGGDGVGLLEAYPAEAAGTGNVIPPLYRSDRVMTDAVPGSGNDFASPIVADGRVYVTGSTFIAVYGLLDSARTLPPVAEPPTRPTAPTASRGRATATRS